MKTEGDVRRPPVGRILLVVAGLCVAFGSIEVGLRIVLARYLNPFEPDREVGYRLKANFTGRYPWISVRTDGQGFRVARAHTPSPHTPILFVGDSVTFGFGILAEESYPSQFGQQIGRPNDVVNAAVPGYNLEQVVRTIRRYVEAHGKPELVVYGLCLNDIVGAEGMVQYEDIDPHALREREKGLLSSSVLVAVLSRRLQRLRTRPASPVDPPDTKESMLRDLSSTQLVACTNEL
jgi:hypothetical protein